MDNQALWQSVVDAMKVYETAEVALKAVLEDSKRNGFHDVDTVMAAFDRMSESRAEFMRLSNRWHNEVANRM